MITRTGRPRFFRESKKEGSYRAQREATFDFAKLRADSIDLHNKVKKSDPITADTYDNLSSIYFIRSSDLTPGQSIHLDIYDTKRLWNAQVRVVKRQEVTTPLGKFRTLMVTSQLRHEGEIAKVGNATFWFTEDNRRIPVRIRYATRRQLGIVSFSTGRIEENKLESNCARAIARRRRRSSQDVTCKLNML